MQQQGYSHGSEGKGAEHSGHQSYMQGKFMFYHRHFLEV
jgi:hypothetical protein